MFFVLFGYRVLKVSFLYLTNNWGAGVSAAWSRQLFKADSLIVGSLQLLLNDSLIVFMMLLTGLFYVTIPNKIPP